MGAKDVTSALPVVRRLYADNLTKHGLSSKSVGWPDETSQLMRFEKLAYVLDYGTRDNVVVNDWGSGYGAMFKFLATMKEPTIGQYHGYDISAEMLSAASDYVHDARAIFHHQSEITQDADFPVVSGTFNVKMDASDREWRKYVKGRIMELAERTRVGFAFNLLTSYVDWKKDDLFYADPCEFFSFCKREVSPHVTLIHDYPLYEWTMIVRM